MAITVENNAKKQLLWIGMGSIVMFFAGLTSAYIVRKPEGNWLDFTLPDSFLISSAVIFISSIILFFVKPILKKNKSISPLLLGVLILGLLFFFFQYKGWQQLISQGVYLTGEGSNPSGSFLYVLTLAHLVHMLGGIIALVFITVKSKSNFYTIDNCLTIELTSFYWHFLALLWICLFCLLKYF